MGDNIYAVETIAAARLAELRLACARMRLAESARDGRRGAGAALGVALIRLGRWLAPGAAAAGANAGVRSGALR
jgi:hypothetical protein